MMNQLEQGNTTLNNAKKLNNNSCCGSGVRALGDNLASAD